MANEIRIVIAEDHPFFRDGLRNALEKESGFRVVAEANGGLTALECIRSHKPDVAVLDISMPDLNGCAVARKVREERIPVEMVFLTIYEDEDIFQQALECDVMGYLRKDSHAAEVVRCIRAVSAGQSYASPSMTTYLVGKTQRIEKFAATIPGLVLLTPHERAILRRVAQDKSSKEIAQEMGIAPKTVDAHRLSICHKLEIHGNHALSRFAIQHRRDV